ncbi:hypothetical protein GCM10008066_10770 [Oxalicibacterium faecigallinarum]|uniref:Uncharacterized protein n=1 Tax=Oxalicibacterium faecigallinarum TaxID=573741 RepID=A0A8J3F2B0_9BURK|nr:hypothetical protein GCM10008066_10770 [Oxalicibacterium faecigallinarum]
MRRDCFLIKLTDRSIEMALESWFGGDFRCCYRWKNSTPGDDAQQEKAEAGLGIGCLNKKHSLAVLFAYLHCARNRAP